MFFIVSAFQVRLDATGFSGEVSVFDPNPKPPKTRHSMARYWRG
jgi:hypothetical protein